MSKPTRTGAADSLERASGQLASASIHAMEERLAWFQKMSPDDRSWIGLVAQTGIAAFIAWYRDPDAGTFSTSEVFSTAPRELARNVTLHQTVEMVRVAIEVVEEELPKLVGEDEIADVEEAILRYSREVGFAAAEVYAKAAELRGAWDARLEALLVDAVIRGETDEGVRSRAAALGWKDTNRVVVVVGPKPDGDAGVLVDRMRRDARRARLDVLTAVHGDRMVAVLGGVEDPHKAADAIAAHFGPGPVIWGSVEQDLPDAATSARSAVAGFRAAPAWPDAPRPVAAQALLAERSLSGDGHARHELVTEVYTPLAAAGPVVLETLAAFLESGNSVEATARMLFVHANTVRYRLRRVTDLTGYVPTNPRDSYTLRIALTLGRLLAPEVAQVETGGGTL